MTLWSEMGSCFGTTLWRLCCESMPRSRGTSLEVPHLVISTREIDQQLQNSRRLDTCSDGVRPDEKWSYS